MKGISVERRHVLCCAKARWPCSDFQSCAASPPLAPSGPARDRVGFEARGSDSSGSERQRVRELRFDVATRGSLRCALARLADCLGSPSSLTLFYFYSVFVDFVFENFRNSSPTFGSLSAGELESEIKRVSRERAREQPPLGRVRGRERLLDLERSAVERADASFRNSRRGLRNRRARELGATPSPPFFQ